MTVHMTPDAFAKSSKLFGFLDDSGRARMMDIAREETRPAGVDICKEGDAGDVFWVILDGDVTVHVEDVVGEKDVATMGAGQFFGEISAVMAQPRSATVTSNTEVKLLAFDREPVMKILEDYPKVKEIVGKVGLIRSEDTVEKLMSD